MVWGGCIVVGALRPDGTFVNQAQAMLAGVPSPHLQTLATAIAVVATSARLTKAAANRVAINARRRWNGSGISPDHTQSDGDTIFCLALGSYASNLTSDELVTLVGKPLLWSWKKPLSVGYWQHNIQEHTHYV